MYEWIGRWTRSKRLGRIGAHLWRLPEWLLYGLLTLTGWTAYWAMPRTRGQVEHAMRELLGMSRSAARRTARQYYRELVLVLVEVLFAQSRLSAKIQPPVHLTGDHHLVRALAAGRGAIVYAPHLGNFFYAYWRLSQLAPCLTVATASSQELRPLYDTFERLGCRGLDYDKTPPLLLWRQLRDHLKMGGVVFILGDFYRDSFPRARLFGRPTRLPNGAARLALEVQAPVIPALCVREGRFEHRLVLSEPLELHKPLDSSSDAGGQARLNAQQAAQELLTRTLESAIRRAPGTWFYWFHCQERGLLQQGEEQEAVGERT